MWMATTGSLVIVQNEVDQIDWGNRLNLTSFITSMTVNALVTALIVFKISKVFREVRSATTLEDKSLGITHGNKLRSVTFIIIESGMALFAIQLARVVVTTQLTTLTYGAAYYAYLFIVSIHEMVNVIISSVIVTLCLLITSIWLLGYSTYPHPGASVARIIFPRQRILGGSHRYFAVCGQPNFRSKKYRSG